MTTLHAAALQLAQKGLAVFPCQPRGKEPACDTGLYAATTDIDRINRWWQSSPDLNIGIATGTASGISVFPCHPKTKTPLVATGFKAATANPDTVHAWWTEHPDALIGVP